jgi:hypothetical protein
MNGELMTYQIWTDQKRAYGMQALLVLGFVLGGTLITACGHGPTRGSTEQTVPTTSETLDVEDRQVLAGDWEYEEGGVVVSLVLDAQGNGEYDFKGGKFITGALTDHSWRGMWIQSENDREGGFEVKLSADYTVGEGRWWYTRIERDTSPTKSGGRFRLIRVQSFPSPEHTSLHP